LAILANIGQVHCIFSDYSRGLEYITRALAIAEEIGDKSASSVCLSSIGCIYSDLGDPSRAVSYQTRALALSEEIGNLGIISDSLAGLGYIYTESGDYPRGLDYYQRALELATQVGERARVGSWMLNVAEVQQKLGNLDASYEAYTAVLQYSKDVLKSNFDVAELLFGFGRLLVEQGKMEEGLARLMEAQTLALELGKKKIAAEGHKSIADVYAGMGEMAQAYEHITKHNALGKEIHTEELKKRIDIFNMRVAVSEIEHGVEVQKLRIQHMEHDLANSAIHLAAQTDLLDHFRTDLTQIFHEIEEPLAALKKIKQKLKALPYIEINWAKFEEQFSSVHPEFTAKLEDKYPALTPQEIRMCALIRVGLRNPEIVKLLCLSERTLENHRFNIRKKLALKTEQNLQEFLSKGI
ncbi:MAG: tetratricopeptide repeat protein, partial [Candidatus Kapaibacterium sp.]